MSMEFIKISSALKFTMLAIGIGLIAIIIYKSIAFTKAITDANGKKIPGSIAELKKVRIGGIEQTILIRGKSIQNPILLYLHSGPGTTEMVPFRYYHKKLEEYFTIVSWDQRGTGKSFSPSLDVKGMNIETLISDTNELMEYLLKRFDKQKIYILGHSWGSALGILTAQRYPDKIYAYIGVGQIVAPVTGEKISYRYLLDIAMKENNLQALKELESINSSKEYLTITGNDKWFSDLQTHRKWLVKLGGEIHAQKDYSFFTQTLIRSNEYTLMDLVKFGLGSRFSLKAMWPEVMKLDFFKQVPKLEVPVFFFAGRHDYNTPAALVEEYYKVVKAPKKDLIWFENSGHHPMYEESELFDKIIVEEV